MQHIAPVSTGSDPWHPGLIKTLPFDIIHALLDYTSPIHLLNLCRTCKALYTHFQNDSIWKHLCASYGLRDFTHFGDITPQSIYTSLLYPYGGLLGLWAGDHPFTGSVMEYRVFPGDEHEQGGIIGEVWQFPPSETSTDDATPPHYVRVLKISFARLPADLTNPGADPTPGTPQVYVLCDGDTAALHPNPRTDPVHKVGTPHLSCLAFIPQSKTVHHIEFYRRTIDLPEFPKPDAAWFDPSPARLPRLPAHPDEPDADQRNIIKIFPALQLPKTWSSPTAAAPRPAISIRCPHGRRCACHPARVPPLPFAALEPAHPQYFPVRRPAAQLQLREAEADPRSAAWTPDSLAGLWYGAYGMHGTEVLHLARGAAHWGDGMCATKLTGDVNVPRGAVSWVLEETDEYGEEPAEFWAELRGEHPPRVLTGRGLLASRGFAESSVIGVIAAIMSPDEIHIFWAPLQVFRIYKRYKGREEETNYIAQDD